MGASACQNAGGVPFYITKENESVLKLVKMEHKYAPQLFEMMDE